MFIYPVDLDGSLIEKWERCRQAYEVYADCGHLNRFDPRTLLPL